MDHAGMHPEAGEGSFLGEMFGLGDFTGVVREGEVGPTTMNVELGTEIAHGHGTTFDMPAGTTGSPRAGPERFARGLCLPEDKVERVFLVGVVGEVAAFVGDGEHSVVVVEADGMGHDAEAGVLLDTVIDATIADIGIATL